MNVREHNFNFGKVLIEDGIAIAEMNEGIVFDTKDNEQLLSYCEKKFKKEPYGYISYRTQSYAVDPTVYIQTAKNSNIKAIAVVSINPINKLNVSVERQFFEHPFEIFSNLTEAKNWLRQLLHT